MKSEWSEKLKSRLEHHEKDAPAGLWDNISQEMIQFEHSRQHRKQVFWRLTAAVAAIALASSLFLHQYSEQIADLKKNERIITENSELTKQREKDLENNVEVKKGNHERSENLQARLNQGVKNETNNINYQHAEEKDEIKEPVLLAEESENEGKGAEKSSFDLSDALARVNNEKNTTKENDSSKESKTNSTLFTPYNHIVRNSYSQKRRTDKWSVSLDASSGLLTSNEKYDNSWYSNVQFLNPTLLMLEVKKRFQAPTNEEQVDKTHHRFPFRLGVKIAYQIHPRWSVESGLRYTQLSSEAIDGNGQWVTERNLRINYIGIPLGISYQLWSKSHFSIYANGGIALDTYISGKDHLKNYENGKLNYSMKSDLQQKPLQFSTYASIGAQYQIGKTINIFAEPSIGYYFDDGTTIQHYFKKHPFAPTVNLGVKFKLHEDKE